MPQRRRRAPLRAQQSREPLNSVARCSVGLETPSGRAIARRMRTVRSTRQELVAGLAVPLDERTRIIVVPSAAMLTLVGRVFDSGRSFILPRAVRQLSAVFERVVRQQAARGLIVVHTNGGEQDAEGLSKARAAAVLAWIRGDEKPWLQNYEDDTPETKRWGAREDRLMLSSVLPEDRDSAGSVDPVERFQILHKSELAVDGIIGPKTRGKLVKEYFALSRSARLEAQPDEDATRFDTEFATHAAGGAFTLQQVDEAKQQAIKQPAATLPNQTPSNGATSDERIDLFLFAADGPITPAPAAPDGKEYLEWIKQSEQFELFVSGGGGASGNQLSMVLFDKKGRTRHRQAKYKLTGPEQLSGLTDDQGRLDHDDVMPGDYELELTLEFFADPDKHDPRDKIVDVYTSRVVVLPGSSTPQVRMLGAVPRCVLARLRGLLFETNKAFLLPSALKDLQKIRTIYEDNNPGELLVVGHTDTTADAAVNDPLSLQRAKSTLAYLEDDAETWLEFYGSGTKESQRWGEIEDGHMRGELLLRGFPAETMTREELIASYMKLDGEELDSGEYQITSTIHGCGENFPVDDAGEQVDAAAEDEKEDALDRRVELFFFEPEFGIVPKPQGKNSPKHSKQYPAWRELAVLALESSVGVGPVKHELVLDDSVLGFLSGARVLLRLPSGEEFTAVANDQGVVTLRTDEDTEFVDIVFAADQTVERAFLVLPESNDPVGAWRRLVNLGYWDEGSFSTDLPPAEPASDADLESLLSTFQEDADLPPTGNLNQATIAALDERSAKENPWKDNGWAEVDDAPANADEPKSEVA